MLFFENNNRLYVGNESLIVGNELLILRGGIINKKGNKKKWSLSEEINSAGSW